MTPKNSPDHLTMKERDFLNAYTDKNSPTYGNGTKSAMQAYGYKEPVARTEAASILAKPRVRGEFIKRLEQQGVSVSFMAERLKQNLSATQEKSYFEKGKMQFRELPDYTNRNKAWDLAAKVLDLYPETKVDLNGDLSLQVAALIGSVQTPPPNEDREDQTSA